MVPRAMAAAQLVITHPGTSPATGKIHRGICGWPAAAYATSARVMMPMDFCASLDPWDRAIRQADTSCMRREARCTF